jgi:hypothetical protein
MLLDFDMPKLRSKVRLWNAVQTSAELQPGAISHTYAAAAPCGVRRNRAVGSGADLKTRGAGGKAG